MKLVLPTPKKSHREVLKVEELCIGYSDELIKSESTNERGQKVIIKKTEECKSIFLKH